MVPALFTFYIQGVLKLKKNNSGAKRLNGLVPFVERPNLVSARVPSRFKRALLRVSSKKPQTTCCDLGRESRHSLHTSLYYACGCIERPREPSYGLNYSACSVSLSPTADARANASIRGDKAAKLDVTGKGRYYKSVNVK